MMSSLRLTASNVICSGFNKASFLLLYFDDYFVRRVFFFIYSILTLQGCDYIYKLSACVPYMIRLEQVLLEPV